MNSRPLKTAMTPTHPGCFVRDEVIGELRPSVSRGALPLSFSDLPGRARLGR